LDDRKSEGGEEKKGIEEKKEGEGKEKRGRSGAALFYSLVVVHWKGTDQRSTSREKRKIECRFLFSFFLDYPPREGDA